MSETGILLEGMSNIILKDKCLNLLNNVEANYSFSEKPAAKNHHHNYKGGLDQHTKEVIQNALKINKMLDRPFDEAEVMLVAFLHDLMKAYLYAFDSEGEIRIINFPCSGEAIVFRLCSRYGIVLSMEQMSAIEFAHGGWSTQANNKFIPQSDLANLLHCADLLSSTFGKTKNPNEGGEKVNG